MHTLYLTIDLMEAEARSLARILTHIYDIYADVQDDRKRRQVTGIQ